MLDADIRGFFDAIDHDWMIRFLEHRIGDKRVIRLVRKWLKAGVLEDGKVMLDSSVVETELADPLHTVSNMGATDARTAPRATPASPSC